MKFTHHPRVSKGETQDRWRFDKRRTYSQDEKPRAYGKPNGFWLSVDDDWRNWVTENWSWPLDQDFHFDVDLTRVLHLSSAEDIDRFTLEYGNTDLDYPLAAWEMNWLRVASEYAGIVIAPYIWSRRLDGNASWYYGWDCASACIWDLSIVKQIKAPATEDKKVEA